MIYTDGKPTIVSRGVSSPAGHHKPAHGGYPGSPPGSERPTTFDGDKCKRCEWREAQFSDTGLCLMCTVYDAIR